ncbi:hypothetical protein E4656_03710 [Natronospirillum operosum]|uniref:DUF3108 domain-containing protein n=1 Tax=Natronospirillum operosum TaxID=2759953 RepID=A0A4Z0WCI0_9GAMM|nr:hypothetical protein [Natronospirillum operosum]TGG95534.1 hypothetical protein E4656_03710 [Natronospirillum operosum]
MWRLPHRTANSGTTVSVLWVFGLLAMLSLPVQGWDLRGTAHDPDSGEIKYLEEHYVETDDKGIRSRRVDYLRPDGERFARKILTHDTAYPYVPSLQWEDIEADTTIEGWLDGDTYYQTIRAPGRNDEERASLGDPDKVAFDAAFDQYLTDHFDQLLEQGRLRFDFLSLSAGRTYSFQAEVTARHDDTVVIEVGPRNTVIRWFVDPIELEYARSAPRLIRFTGITNFRRDGDLVEADIHYEYAQ